MFNVNKDTLSPFQCWTIIDNIGWPEVENTDVIKAKLLKALSPKQVRSLRDFLGDRSDELHEAVNAYREENDLNDRVSTDRMNDTVNHIIGLGAHTFKQTLDNPKSIQHRYDDGAYTESFSYAIPYVSDYEKISFGHYTNRFYRIEKEIEADESVDTSLAHTICRNLQLHSPNNTEWIVAVKDAANQLGKSCAYRWALLNAVSDYEAYILEKVPYDPNKA